ncbi:oligopeptide transporter, OPT family [Achromobacter sp. Marseille-Q0513]|uniref:OPT family oligopeptide transporter n=1 Tax=Achromobacter sp. Marseille-Q0513 TaxID=2829161 RepID=UPI001B92305F|nr:oligopeptide transporter, OPT family [Achromobacter sp. Marseille-Q0513]MBR8652527.1 oligopeptide transporter, OPT family [Achromobacter sp. Marseille-Q0513]
MAQPISVPANVTLPELTFRGVLLGALITVIFTASNVFLGLKVGLTFSSAIPAAVISMSVLRLFKDANILENNMVQTQASAAGTLSSIIFILPALVMMGYWQGFPFWQTLGICAAGGMLGVMFSIPLRHVMVVQSELPYPEGVAAAEILRVGSAERAQEAQADAAPGKAAKPAATGMADIAAGGVVAAAVSFAASGLRVLGESVSGWFALGGAVFRLPMGFSLALLGAGYLIGIVAGLAMLTGLVIAWGIAVPVLTSMGDLPAGKTLAQYATGIWSSQVRFIGAGVIGVGAIWTLATLFVPMARGVKASFSALSKAGKARAGQAPRTERDLSAGWISIVTLVLVAILVITFQVFLADAPLSAAAVWKLVAYAVLFAFVFGFLVAAACGYMAGLVGSSSSPISGVGIVAIVLVSLLMLALGGELLEAKNGVQMTIALAIFSTSAVVAVASIANDNLQDLKTGWLVGATPWRQQVALLIGCVVGAAVISPVLELLYNAYGFADAMPREGMDPGQALSAPQATLMLAIARGIFSHQLNWTMILIGMAVGVGLIAVDAIMQRTCRVARMPVLAVGIGIYLPPTVAAPLVAGALLAWALERALRRRAAAAGQRYDDFADAANRRGVLIASGLIVGESLVGVLMAAIIGASGSEAPLALVGADFGTAASYLGLVVFAFVAVLFWRRVMRLA